MPFFSVRCSTADPVVLCGDALGDLAGPVGRAVVDDEHAKAIRSGSREHLAGGGDDRLDILGLVVGGEYQPGLAGHAGRRTLEPAAQERAGRSGACVAARAVLPVP